ncbi:BTB/POZ domain-containing protein 9 isoform X2 [Lampetra fluviatilis]
MCDSQGLRASGPAGELEHVGLLSAHLGVLCGRDEYSDVVFVVDGTRFPAHRVLLAARCHYFRFGASRAEKALLYGGMKESQPEAEVRLDDTTAEAFAVLLRYIYSGRVSLGDLREECLLDLLSLAHRLGFPELENALSTYLCSVLSVSNVCTVYDVASLYSLSTLCNTCEAFADKHAAGVLQSDGFFSLSKGALLRILSRDSFAAPERDIFSAVVAWCGHNPGEDAREAVAAVRLPLMNLSELLDRVRPSGLLSPDAILDAIKARSQGRDSELNYRGVLLAEENVATLRHGAVVTQGELKAALLDGDTTTYDLDRGFSRHPIEPDTSRGGAITVRLGTPAILNHIRMLLWDRDSRSYSYYIEVSMDEQDWVRVVDHSRHFCRSWQLLYFPARVCRFLRIVGTHNTVNRVFHVVAFECMFTNRPFVLDGGLVVPQENVATIVASASVIEGVSRSRNALLNGDTRHYDWDCGYTCHQLGSGAIVVQLAQPYIIGSMRLLLWDCDDRSYSFYVEVSTEQQTWHRVADRTKQACRSWQTITFDKRPVSFIRIVGTHNTANEVFHCVHFECPASVGPYEEDGVGDNSEHTGEAEGLRGSLGRVRGGDGGAQGLPNVYSAQPALLPDTSPPGGPAAPAHPAADLSVLASSVLPGAAQVESSGGSRPSSPLGHAGHPGPPASLSGSSQAGSSHSAPSRRWRY